MFAQDGIAGVHEASAPGYEFQGGVDTLSAQLLSGPAESPPPLVQQTPINYIEQAATLTTIECT